MLTSAIYMLNNPLEIAYAFELFESSEMMVVDFNHVLFDDHELAITKINEAAQLGAVPGR